MKKLLAISLNFAVLLWLMRFYGLPWWAAGSVVLLCGMAGGYALGRPSQALTTRLITRWREKAVEAEELANRYEQTPDHSGNVLAFRKECRIWKSCAEELDAAARYDADIVCEREERPRRCFEMRPGEPGTWCAGCRAHARIRSHGSAP